MAQKSAISVTFSATISATRELDIQGTRNNIKKTTFYSQVNNSTRIYIYRKLLHYIFQLISQVYFWHRKGRSQSPSQQPRQPENFSSNGNMSRNDLGLLASILHIRLDNFLNSYLFPDFFLQWQSQWCQRSEQFHHIDFHFYVLDPSLAGQLLQIQEPQLQLRFQDQPRKILVDPPHQIWVDLQHRIPDEGYTPDLQYVFSLIFLFRKQPYSFFL